MTNPLNIWRRFGELYTLRNEPEYLRPLAEIFWRTLLVLVACGIAGVITFAALEFWSVIDNLNGGSGTSAPAPVALDRAGLDAALQDIQQRQTDSAALRSAPSPVVDPAK